MCVPVVLSLEMPLHWRGDFCSKHLVKVTAHHFCHASVPGSQIQHPLPFPFRLDPEKTLKLFLREHKHGAAAQKAVDRTGQEAMRSRSSEAALKPAREVTRWWRFETRRGWRWWRRASGRAAWRASWISPCFGEGKPVCPHPGDSEWTESARVLRAGPDSSGTTANTSTLYIQQLVPLLYEVLVMVWILDLEDVHATLC